MTEQDKIEKAKENLFLIMAISKGATMEEAKKIWQEQKESQYINLKQNLGED